MGRYLERTQHLCRLLRLQTEAAAAAAWTVPSGKLIGLSRSHTGMDQPPPGSRLELHSGADVALVDAFTFEHSTPPFGVGAASRWGVRTPARRATASAQRCRLR